PLRGIYQLRFDPDVDVEQAAAAYQADPSVLYAQPNYLMRDFGTKSHREDAESADLSPALGMPHSPLTSHQAARPNDPRYADQWALPKLGWDRIYERARTFDEVLVAIVDSGVDYGHEDLISRIWINQAEQDGLEGVDDDGNGYVDDLMGWDFTDAPTLPGIGDYLVRDNDPMDESGHGTHVAGIVGAASDNGLGIAGIAPNARLMCLRAGLRLSIGGFLEDDDVAAAIVYAADNGAQVINMSWGDPRLSPLIRDVIRYAAYRGCLLIAASGNEGKEGLYYPAGLDETIAVSAVESGDNLASYANYGWNLDVVAPGSNILSTKMTGSYGTLSGTSMAAPHVSGLAALILGENPTYSADEVKNIILRTAVDLGTPYWDTRYGVGRIDLSEALSANLGPAVQILFPQTGDGGDSLLTVTGTAAGGDIARWELSYGTGIDPETWTMLAHSPTQVYQDSLAAWNTSDLADSLYVLRLQAIGYDGARMEDRVIVTVDHTPPQIESIRIADRLDGIRWASFIEWATDDATTGRILLRTSGSDGDPSELDANLFSTTHSVEISQSLKPDTYEFTIIARNKGGLATVSRDSTLTIRSDVVSEQGYRNVAELPGGYLAPQSADFDGDGQREIILMPYGDSPYQPVTFYECTADNTFESVSTLSEALLPWNVCDADGDGRWELMGVQAARLFLFEGLEANTFPTEAIWHGDDVWGGEAVDLDRDGRIELIARSDRVKALTVFENDGDNNFPLSKPLLLNPTTGDNDIGTRFAIGDYDGDGRAEIVFGDSDGDLFAYEAQSNDIYTATIIYEQNRDTAVDARHVAGGSDLDGDGKLEFIVARTVGDPMDPSSDRWVISVYQARGNDTYEIEWQTEILEVTSKGNGIAIGDTDGDGTDEFLVCARPNLYLFKSTGANDYRPIWHAETGQTYVPLISDADSDGLPEIIFNQEDRVVIYEREPQTSGPPAPTGLAAVPLDALRVQLTWNRDAGDARTYRLYRGIDPGKLEPIAEGALSVPYIDHSLQTDVSYCYALSVVDTNRVPSEGPRSPVVRATPNSAPRLLDARSLSPRHVALRFSEPLGPSAGITTHYAITADTATTHEAPAFKESVVSFPLYPSSTILDQNNQRVLLGFDKILPPGTYLVQATGIRDTTGVFLSPDAHTATFSVKAAVSQTQILSAEALSSTEIRLVFSEGIVGEGLSPQNFSILPEAAIQSIIHLPESREIRLLLAGDDPIKAHGQRYEIRAVNLTDRNGALFSDLAYLKWAREDLAHFTLFPNPCDFSRSPITFANLTAQAIINLYTLDGQLVKTLIEQDGDGGTEWDGLNERGKPIGSGIYLYSVESEAQRRMGKFAVIR
ncbi:MAG: S8 family serine peptidase, partial [Candidatus Latescibacterota bacterium]